jgi:hypothetical protein
MRMVEPGGRADLAEEALGAERVRELGVEHLERYAAAVLEVAGEIDRRHVGALLRPEGRTAAGQVDLR